MGSLWGPIPTPEEVAAHAEAYPAGTQALCPPPRWRRSGKHPVGLWLIRKRNRSPERLHVYPLATVGGAVWFGAGDLSNRLVETRWAADCEFAPVDTDGVRVPR